MTHYDFGVAILDHILLFKQILRHYIKLASWSLGHTQSSKPLLTCKFTTNNLYIKYLRDRGLPKELKNFEPENNMYSVLENTDL